MRRRLVLAFSLLAAFGLGLFLAAGSFPDRVQDLGNDLLVAWYGYKLRAGSGGTFYVMIAGFLLGQGLYLAGRQLWRGPLRRARGRFADLDAGLDVTTHLPSRFALQRALERNIEWAEGDPSTRSLSLALVRLEGIEGLNATGTLAGTELLKRAAAIVRDAAVPLSVTGPLRWWARGRLGPRLVLFGRNPPSRCAARWGGATFGLAFRGVDARKALVVVRELVADLEFAVRRLSPGGDLGVRAGLCLFSSGAKVADLADGARKALEQTPAAGGLAAAHEAGEGSAAMLEEFKDLPRVTVSFQRRAFTAAPTEARPESPSGLLVGWLKGWGVALACLAGGPVLLSSTARGADAAMAYPWPDTLKELPVVDASGAHSTPIVRRAARPVSDGVWEVSLARAVQVDPDSPRPAQSVVFVQLGVVNRSERIQRISMFDAAAIDAEGRALRLDAKGSLAFEDPLKSRDLEPGARWSGWLRFIRKGTGVRSLIFRPTRETRLFLPLVGPEPAPRAPKAG